MTNFPTKCRDLFTKYTNFSQKVDLPTKYIGF